MGGWKTSGTYARGTKNRSDFGARRSLSARRTPRRMSLTQAQLRLNLAPLNPRFFGQTGGFFA
ncbi:MAG TPA: hypothetical protein DCZ55_22100 [Cyanobacteria bacterium UBA11371]|nr:hypothetical protein [Cyanobacteria bacterium UBA11371]HBE33614.1 hypothetical protein [Cyanobacteria bacterium UBA11368]